MPPITILCRGQACSSLCLQTSFVPSLRFALLSLLARSEHEKEIEILLLRQQIRIMQRTRARSPRLAWWEKLPLSILAAKVIQGPRHLRSRLAQSLLVFSPKTVLRWHCELVRRTWTFPQRRAVGRLRIAAALEALSVRLAKENPRSRLQHNRRRSAQARLWYWALNHSRRTQTPASPCITLACSAEQHSRVPHLAPAPAAITDL